MRMLTLMAAIATLTLAMPVAAQGGMGGGMGGGAGRGQMQQRQNELLFRGITLTESQRVRIDSIQAASREASMALVRELGMQDPSVREKVMAVRERHNADIRATLTDEQRAQFDKNLAEMPGMGQMGPGGRRPPRRR